MPAPRSLLRAGLMVAALLVIGGAARRQKAGQQVAVRRVEVKGGQGPVLGVGVGEQDDAGGAVRPEQDLKAGGDGGWRPCRMVIAQSGPPWCPDCPWLVAYTGPLRCRRMDHA